MWIDKQTNINTHFGIKGEGEVPPSIPPPWTPMRVQDEYSHNEEDLIRINIAFKNRLKIGVKINSFHVIIVFIFEL